MKRVVNGLLYDTDNSTLVYTDKIRGRRYYMTPNNRYFVLYGTGELIPTTEGSIKALLGSNDVSRYIELFGEPEEA